MKIISIVGIDNSGKTSTIVALIEAIRRRGKKAGVCKTMCSPTFTLDHSSSDTLRYRRAGSELSCTRAKGETAFLYPEAFPLSKALESYKECDYVLLEGDYFAPVPRIVCACCEEDALIRLNTRTLAFAGRICENPAVQLPLPCFNALTEAETLLDYIDKKIPNIMPCSLLDTLLPPVSGITDDGFHPQEATAEKESIQVLFKGKSVKLSDEQYSALLKWINVNAE